MSNSSITLKESEAYKNFINSVDSEVTKKNYRCALNLFMKYFNLDREGDYEELLLTSLLDSIS